MTPAEISAITSLISALSALGKWPFVLLLFLVLAGPWILAVVLSFREQRRFEQVKRMYEDNVKLVKDYNQLAESQKDVLVMNVQTNQKLIDAIEKNQFCPMIRLEKRAKGVQE